MACAYRTIIAWKSTPVLVNSGHCKVFGRHEHKFEWHSLLWLLFSSCAAIRSAPWSQQVP
jgi:hypothetical protein